MTEKELDDYEQQGRWLEREGYVPTGRMVRNLVAEVRRLRRDGGPPKPFDPFAGMIQPAAAWWSTGRDGEAVHTAIWPLPVADQSVTVVEGKR